MSVQYAHSKLRVPSGFQDLLEGLCREILREQPHDIIKFAADYFKSQLAIRRETGQDDSSLSGSASSTEGPYVSSTDRTDADAKRKLPAASQLANANENASKSFDGDNDVHASQLPLVGNRPAAARLSKDEAATRIQAVARGHRVRQEMKGFKSQAMTSAQAATYNSTEHDATDRRVDEEHVAAALMHAQSGIEHQTFPTSELAADGDKANVEERDDAMRKTEAAVKIQANFRGYNSRKKIKVKPPFVVSATEGDLVDDEADINSEPAVGDGNFEEAQHVGSGGLTSTSQSNEDDIGVDGTGPPIDEEGNIRADWELRGQTSMDALAADNVSQVVNTEVDVDHDAVADSVDTTDGPAIGNEHGVQE